MTKEYLTLNKIDAHKIGYRYSYGSTKETRDWMNKCKDRGLIEDPKLYRIYAELEKLPRAINQLIKYTN